MMHTLAGLPKDIDVVILRPDRRGAAWKSAGSLAFVLVFIFAIDDPNNPMRTIGAAFFGLCAVGWGRMLLPGTYLKLEPECFTVHAGIRHFTYRWQDVELFGLWGIGMRCVCFRLSGRFPNPGPLHTLNRVLSGFDDGIPDAFEVGPTELVGLLTDWHSRFAAQ